MRKTWQRNHRWFFTDIVWPFALTRSVLLLVGWFSQYFTQSTKYFPAGIEPRSWAHTNIRILDIWARWDSGWYLDIVQNGYVVPKVSHTVVASNIAFWPLYPYMIRWFSFLVPESVRSTEFLLASGVFFSNVCLLLALAVIYKAILHLFKLQRTAQLTILYLLVFPTSFIFSSFYTESLFLLLSAVAIYFALKKQWLAASSAVALAAISRPPGIVVAIPVVVTYLATYNWRLGAVIKKSLPLFLIPVFLGGFLLYSKQLTGDFLAPISSHQVWNRTLAWPWETLLHSSTFIGYVSNIEKIIAIGFLLLAAGSLFVLPLSLGIYSAALVIIPLLSGSLQSITRIYSVIFPLLAVLVHWIGYRKKTQQFIVAIFFTIQILFFIAWCQLYWIG